MHTQKKPEKRSVKVLKAYKKKLGRSSRKKRKIVGSFSSHICELSSGWVHSAACSDGMEPDNQRLKSLNSIGETRQKNFPPII